VLEGVIVPTVTATGGFARERGGDGGLRHLRAGLGFIDDALEELLAR